jgi:hypothetical protein
MTVNANEPEMNVTNGHAMPEIAPDEASFHNILADPEIAEAFIRHLHASRPPWISSASEHYPAFAVAMYDAERDSNAGLITFDEYLQRHAQAIGTFVLAEFCDAVLRTVFEPLLTSAAHMAAELAAHDTKKKSRTTKTKPSVKSRHGRRAQRRSGKVPRARRT